MTETGGQPPVSFSTKDVARLLFLLRRQKQKKLIMLPSEILIWQPEFTDKTLSRKPGAVQNSADASYLQQMALSFIALRLNVSPEIVDASHQALLQYIRPGAQNQMKVILAEEAKLIKKDNVNSAFFQTSVRVWPQYGRVEIRGIRKTWIGNSEPFTDIKHYILILKRENGVTWLDNFGETDDEKK